MDITISQDLHVGKRLSSGRNLSQDEQFDLVGPARMNEAKQNDRSVVYETCRGMERRFTKKTTFVRHISLCYCKKKPPSQKTNP